MGKRVPLTVERFMTILGDVDPFACWPWPMTKTHDGYGVVQFRRSDGKQFGTVAHKWLYQNVVGPIPENLELDHAACQRRDCVNPLHLEPVTHTENMQRSGPALATHCSHGHEYSDKNTRITRGHRRCRPCEVRRSQDYIVRKRSKSKAGILTPTGKGDV